MTVSGSKNIETLIDDFDDFVSARIHLTEATSRPKDFMTLSNFSVATCQAWALAAPLLHAKGSRGDLRISAPGSALEEAVLTGRPGAQGNEGRKGKEWPGPVNAVNHSTC